MRMRLNSDGERNKQIFRVHDFLRLRGNSVVVDINVGLLLETVNWPISTAIVIHTNDFVRTLHFPQFTRLL